MTTSLRSSDNSFLDLLLSRRSVKPAAMAEPGPSEAQLEQILTAASRVPDHKKLEPWRFIVFEGEARAAFGEVLAEACKAEEKEPPSEVRLETERTRLLRAPTVVAVISRVIADAGRAGVGAGAVVRRGLLSTCAWPPMRWASAPAGSPSGMPTARRVRAALGLGRQRADGRLRLHRHRQGAAARPRAARTSPDRQPLAAA